VVFAALLVMLIFVGFSNGWIKALILFVACFLSLFLALFIMAIIGVEKGTSMAIGRFIIGAWALGLILYNIINGNIKNK